MERDETFFEVRHLSIRFGSIGFLRDLTFHVPDATILGILGPNAGQDLLFKTLMGAIPYEGEVRRQLGTRIGSSRRNPISSALSGGNGGDA